MSFPLVVKPIEGQGQKGIRRANNIAELQNAISYANKYNVLDQNAGVIIEEFSEGPEISISAWICNGELLWVGTADRITINPLPAIGIAFQHVVPMFTQKISVNSTRHSLRLPKLMT